MKKKYKVYKSYFIVEYYNGPSISSYEHCRLIKKQRIVITFRDEDYNILSDDINLNWRTQNIANHAYSLLREWLVKNKIANSKKEEIFHDDRGGLGCVEILKTKANPRSKKLIKVETYTTGVPIIYE
jgi:hypothetical protein